MTLMAGMEKEDFEVFTITRSNWHSGRLVKKSKIRKGKMRDYGRRKKKGENQERQSRKRNHKNSELERKSCIPRTEPVW